MSRLARERLSRLSLLPLVLLIACVSRGPWREKHEPTPWISAGAEAKLFVREVEPGPFMVAGVTYDVVWRDRAGNDFSLNRYQDEIERFMVSTGVMRTWPESHSGNDRGIERLAPYRFTIVSVNPTVVLMSPFDFGSPIGRSESEILAPTNGRRCLGNHYLINDLECGTSAAYASGMVWFSPDMNVQPSPINWRGSSARIELPHREVLRLEIVGENVATARQLSR